ncbi:MAG: DMT family transporter [Pseudonocardia sp.]
MNLLLLASALLVGCLLAVQASVNQRLNKAVGTPYGASTLQLAVAAGALAVLATAVGAIGAIGLVPEVEPWWLLLGGMASPLYITAGILLFPRLGALTAVGLFVTGQVFASLGLDLFGLLAVPQQPLSIGIVLGALAVLVGITVIIRGQQLTRRGGGPGTPAGPITAVASGGTAAPSGGIDGSGTATRSAIAVAPSRTATAPSRTATQSGWVLLGLLAGAVLPIQGAINAQLRQDIGQPLAVGTISFVVATLTIAIVLIVLLALRGTPTPQLQPLRAMPWWGWLGGFCAAAYVIATFLLIPTIGAAVTVALTVTGQQVASALIDHFGWFRMPRRPLTPPRIGGLALLIAGSVLVQLT